MENSKIPRCYMLKEKSLACQLHCDGLRALLAEASYSKLIVGCECSCYTIHYFRRRLSTSPWSTVAIISVDEFGFLRSQTDRFLPCEMVFEGKHEPSFTPFHPEDSERRIK